MLISIVRNADASPLLFRAVGRFESFKPHGHLAAFKDSKPSAIESAPKVCISYFSAMLGNDGR
ncbi:MAG TPA: hypothetical protein DCP92_04285 [Nitrospiraceae bacterium]|jgi:hypothetical protein|nr:hypothetical protein [Nitrospiraceae bacterium]